MELLTHLTDGFIARSKNRDWIKLLYCALSVQLIALPISDKKTRDFMPCLTKQPTFNVKCLSKRQHHAIFVSNCCIQFFPVKLKN